MIVNAEDKQLEAWAHNSLRQPYYSNQYPTTVAPSSDNNGTIQ
jgi:hypothetical protein